MKLTRLWTLGWFVLLTLTQLARSQAFVPAQQDGQGGFVSLLPTGDAPNAPLFLDPNASSPIALNAQGNVGGKSSTNLGNLQIGFDYLRPFWTSRDFILAVPTASAGNFPLLGDVGHVDNQFAFVPVVKYKYDIVDLDFSIQATGTFLNLAGRLERKLADANAGTGLLTANSSLTIVTANLPEFTTRVYYADLFANSSHLHHWSLFDDLVIDIGVGSRYSSIQQNYTGSLTNSVPAGSNVSTRYATQNFRGVGITSSLGLSLPVRQNLVLFSNMRGSVLVGDNVKDSTLTVTVAGQPGIASAISQNRTEFIPIAELELGTEWGMDLGERLRDNAPPPLFTVRLAASGQFWGNVGPLSAGSAQGFTNSNLFLVGAHIMVGFHR